MVNSLLMVGRSGSAKVANWFNDQMSGYNSDSVNGDRTTFDHTADKLNFAFVGQLDLTIQNAQMPQGETVTFSNVGIAQGSTTFSNNWWFGQTCGQHTKDSDGSNSILALGTTEEGEMVYASFLRGGNGTNEITLSALAIPEIARTSRRMA